MHIVSKSIYKIFWHQVQMYPDYMTYCYKMTYMVIGEVNCMQTMPALLFSTKTYEVASVCACISSFCAYTTNQQRCIQVFDMHKKTKYSITNIHLLIKTFWVSMM